MVDERGEGRFVHSLGLVGVAAHNANLTPLVTGPVIQLTERHAKIRNNR